MHRQRKCELLLYGISLALHSQWQPHNDIITSLEICVRNDRTLVLSASMDCSVALWDIYGNQIGIFGQVRSEDWTCNKSRLIASKLFHVPSF